MELNGKVIRFRTNTHYKWITINNSNYPFSFIEDLIKKTDI